MAAPLGPDTVDFLRVCRGQIRGLLTIPRVEGREGHVFEGVQERGKELKLLREKIDLGTFSAADRCRLFQIHAELCGYAQDVGYKVKGGLRTRL